MNKNILTFVVAIILLSVTGTAAAADNELEAFKKAIRAKYDLKEMAFANNDPKPILEKFYTGDVLSVGPDGVSHEGTEGIRPVYENPDIIGGNVKIESYKTQVSGNSGWDWVNFHVNPADPAAEPFTFKMLFLWEKIEGEWMSQGEMYVVGEFDTSN
ncbi:MAG: nuclear transport factor 2 family protein [Gammaproteobacteria bacterium]|nr:nuclear transport factor 2 family protein [Gammaproteobacteria bacterium]